MGTSHVHAGAWTTLEIFVVLIVSKEPSVTNYLRQSRSSEPLPPDNVIVLSPRYTLCPICGHGFPTAIACKAPTVMGWWVSPQPCEPALSSESRDVPGASQLWVLCLGSFSPGASDGLRRLEPLTVLHGFPAPCQPPSQTQSLWVTQIFPSGKMHWSCACASSCSLFCCQDGAFSLLVARAFPSLD